MAKCNQLTFLPFKGLTQSADQHVWGRFSCMKQSATGDSCCINTSYFNNCLLYCYCVSATENLRCRRHSVFGSVRPWVSLWVCASRKLCEHHISKTNEGNFTQFWSRMYLGSQNCWLDFGVKRSTVKVTARRGITVDCSPSSSIELCH